MPKHAEPKNVAEMMPDELTALKALVQEFMEKVTSIDAEIETLKDDRKELIEEYSNRLDVRTLNTALRIIKLQNSIVNKGAFDCFIDVLTDPAA